ncbi:MAG TPA: methyl-accepting chemotaxis protein [Pyrinomonadaceae bacterium]|jgi:methyl-accepting chemotaxis protein
MPRTSSNSLLNSLKGKIWLATSGLAFFICVFGLISYIIVSTLTSDPFYAIFIPFLFVSFAVMVFGWWLAGEVISPIEKVTLLAKSLERGATTLPKTSGSTETDELLQTLYRNSQQIQRVVSLMDEVANGNFSIALTPLQNSDRLTNSFQQLLAKVSESIHAQQNLEKLEAAIAQINVEISAVRTGNLSIEIKSDSPPTKEIAETFKYLLHHLNEIIAQVKSEARGSQFSVAEIQKTISVVVLQDEARVQEMTQAALALKQIPNSVQKISEDLANSASSAGHSIEKARNGSRSAQANLSSVSQLRKQIQEAIKQIQKLGDRSQEIGKIAKTVRDLAHRTNMIALNASIQAEDARDSGRGLGVIVEEIERLAARADNMNKQISGFNKSIAAEINQAEMILQSTVGEAANLSKFAIETSNSLSELEKYIGQFLNLQIKLAAYSQEKSEETDKAFQVFVESISETEAAVKNLKESDASVASVAKTMKNLDLSVADFKLSAVNNYSEFSPGSAVEAFEEKI